MDEYLKAMVAASERQAAALEKMAEHAERQTSLLAAAMERGTVAINGGTIAGGTVGEAPKAEPKAEAPKAEPKAEAKAEEKKPAEPEKPRVTIDEVRAALKNYAALEGKEAAIDVLKAHGAASVGELSEDKYAAVIEAVK